MENKSILTIAIPTYNRIEQLRRTLTSLIPQLDDRCYLMILDNNSDKNVADEISSILNELPTTQYSAIRNRVNVGADLNIFRCFEYCHTQWLWTLSDDDEIESDAIKTIFQHINCYPNAININFYSPHVLHKKRETTEIFYGQDGLIDSIDSFGANIFISANIYNMSLIKSFYQANRMAYSCVSQWLIILFNMQSDIFLIRSNNIIVRNVYSSQKYTSINLTIINGFITLFDLPLPKHTFKKLRNKILEVDKGWIKFSHIIKTLIIENKLKGNDINIKYHLKRYFYRFYKYGRKTNYFMFLLILISLYISERMTYQILRQLIKIYKHIDINDYVNKNNIQKFS